MAEEIKKPAESKAEKKGFGEKIKKFFRDYKSEFKKIKWPTWAYTKHQTFLVLCCIVVIAVCIFLLDTCLSKGIQAIASLL